MSKILMEGVLHQEMKSHATLVLGMWLDLVGSLPHGHASVDHGTHACLTQIELKQRLLIFRRRAQSQVLEPGRGDAASARGADD